MLAAVLLVLDDDRVRAVFHRKAVARAEVGCVGCVVGDGEHDDVAAFDGRGDVRGEMGADLIGRDDVELLKRFVRKHGDL
ncbi:hypothetical protein CBA19CS91_12250 [Paraburkholderia hospita]|nr:hypothetical protein CBA19CS91_12250 [Paraburkholderia hospita]